MSRIIEEELIEIKNYDKLIDLEIDLQNKIFELRKKIYKIPNWFYKINHIKNQEREDNVAKNINQWLVLKNLSKKLCNIGDKKDNDN